MRSFYKKKMLKLIAEDFQSPELIRVKQKWACKGRGGWLNETNSFWWSA